MAIDAYVYFKDYSDKFLASESQVDTSNNQETMFKQFEFDKAAAAKDEGSPSGLFQIEDYSFDIEQILNIGSQSTGAGAGAVTFNAFSITRRVDRSSPKLFQLACAGTPFKQVAIGLRKASGGKTSGQIFCVFLFKLVAVKTISWSHSDESPMETCTFEYGALQVHYTQQNPDGKMGKVIAGGWNRIKNVQDDTLTEIK